MMPVVSHTEGRRGKGEAGADPDAIDLQLGCDIESASMRAVSFVLVLLAAGCGGNAWTPKDTVSATHAVQLGKACDELCAADAASCTPQMAASCVESIDCNIGSMLHRHGAADLMDGGAGGCQSQ